MDFSVLPTLVKERIDKYKLTVKHLDKDELVILGLIALGLLLI